jgi:hypothetical protein
VTQSQQLRAVGPLPELADQAVKDLERALGTLSLRELPAVRSVLLTLATAAWRDGYQRARTAP